MSVDAEIAAVKTFRDMWLDKVRKLRKEKADAEPYLPRTFSDGRLYVTRFDGDIATYELCVDHANFKLEALGEVNIERAVLRKELWNQLTTLTNAEEQLETGVGSINSPNLPSEEKVWELRKKFDETRAKLADL
jgi:hypothetical protein